MLPKAAVVCALLALFSAESQGNKEDNQYLAAWNERVLRFGGQRGVFVENRRLVYQTVTSTIADRTSCRVMESTFEQYLTRLKPVNVEIICTTTPHSLVHVALITTEKCVEV